MSAVPLCLGPEVMKEAVGGDVPPYQPLFDVQQLGRFQELYESAPYIYGRIPQRDVSRPTFLDREEEEERLAAIQEEKRLREEEKRKKETEKDFGQSEILRQVMEENSKLKEMIWNLKRRTPPPSVQFETPDQEKGAKWTRELEQGASQPEEASRLEVASKPEGVSGPEAVRLKPEEMKGPDQRDTMKFMMMMLEGMQKLMLDKEDGKGRGSGGGEIVKPPVELPRLPD